MNDMPNNLDQTEGRLKQAAGSLTGDDELKREGEMDEASGDLKEKIDDVTDKVKSTVDDVRSRLNV